jgi:DNA-binding NtrC family response regulator
MAGLVERAHGGTVLFDEIGDLTPAILQLLLETRRRDPQGLRTLQRLGHFPSGGLGSRLVVEAERSVRGYLQDDRSIKVDVAFLAATNQNLEDAQVRERLEFRADYFEELGVSLTLPSLNERREDIPLISEAILEKSQFKGMKVSREAMETLVCEDWRDRNIVALEKAVIGAARKARDFGEILPRHMPHRAERVAGRGSEAMRRTRDVEPSRMALPHAQRKVGADVPKPDSPGAFAEGKVRYLAARVEDLVNALAATCVWEAGRPKYSVTRAVQRMLGRQVETTDALRLAREILDDVLQPLVYERDALRRYGLDDLQARVKADTLLNQIGRYVRREASMETVNAELQRLHDMGPLS